MSSLFLNIKKVIDFSKLHINHAITLMFLVGFALDMYALPPITNKLYIYIGFTYFILTFILLYFKFLFENSQISWRGISIKTVNDLAFSFFSGSFLSYVLVYYLRSGDSISSLPILIFIIFSVIANEIINNKYSENIFNFIIVSVSTTFFALYNIPVLIGYVNDMTFIVSIIISVATLLLFVYIIKKSIINKSLKMYSVCVLVPLIISLLYFTGTMPAVPLTMRDAGIYSNIQRVNGEYIFDNLITNKKENIFTNLLFWKYDSFVITNSTVYFYCSVISPTDVTSNITHVWQKYDINTKTWKEINRVTYKTSGGRAEGYRGYSFKSNITSGQYKVKVQVGERVLGQKTFTLLDF